MRGIPDTIPDFGTAAMVPRQNPGFDATSAAGFTSEDYFVWSRVDGVTSLRDILLMTASDDPDHTVEILRKLRRIGAVLLPDEEPHPVEGSAAAPAVAAAPRVAVGGDGVPIAAAPDQSGGWAVTELTAMRRPDGSIATAAPGDPDPELRDLTPEEAAAMEEELDVPPEDRRRILSAMRVIAHGDYFEILGCERSADRRALKRAYFRLSKEFHPDRYYGRDTGSFGPRLARIFEAVAKAYAVLENPRHRDAYERARRGEPAPADRPQTRQEHAAELYERACAEEHLGDPAEAIKLFAASLRLDPKASHLRRAASCAARAGKLSEAMDYAKKAAELRPGDPSYHRSLADVYRAAGRLAQAEQALVHALELKTENDRLAGELRDDLEAVRRRMQQGAGD